MALTRFASLCLLTLVSVGCDSEKSAAATPPPGVTCSSIMRAATGDAVLKALVNSRPGACVVVTGNVTSSTSLAVGSGVTLVGEAGPERASLSVTDSAAPGAIVLADGAQLGNLDVLGAPRAGVVVTAANAKIFDVKVSGGKGTAVAVVADGTPGAITIERTTLEKNAYGLHVFGAGASVTVTGGRIAENGGTSLASGAGAIAAGGARLVLDGVTVEKNEGPGVLLDGATTRAEIKGATVSENRERGIWAQGLQGTLEAPALTIQDTQLTKNRILAVGGVQLKGIIIVGGSVKETVSAPAPTANATLEQVGDGLGILGGSTDFKIERTNFERNDRAAGVVDGTEVGIIIVGGKVEPGPSGLKFVVQNSKGDIQIPEADRSTPPQPLPISAPTLKVPSPI